MKKLHLLLLCAVLLASCGPKPQEVAESWQSALNSGDIDSALSYLSDDIAVTIAQPGPEGGAVYAGQSETRAGYERIIALKGFGTLSNCIAEDDTITCESRYSDEGLGAMGVDFIEGPWVAVVRDGKIESYSSTMSSESLAKIPPPLAEKRLTTPEEIAGMWAAKFNDDITILHDFRANGILAISALGMRQSSHPSVPYPIGSDGFSFQDDLLHFNDARGDCPGFVADYEVYGTYEYGRLVELRFVLVGEDRCTTRKQTLDGNMMLPHE